MNYTEEYLKYKRNKKLKGIFIGIGILLVAIIGSTYAFFTYSKSLQAFTLTSSGITASFSSGTNQINITNGYPISDEFALQNLNQLDYIDFTISGNVEDEDQGITYEIYLTEDDNNTLDPNYIKVYITDENGNLINSKTTPKIFNSLENTTYSKDATTGKIIYKVEGMPSNYNKSFRIYAWIDKDYEQNVVQEEFSFYVNLYAYNDTNKLGSDLIKKAAVRRANDGSNCLTTVEEDGITYISGSKECINFNYVWWSGKLWRITAIYPDGAMKMVTDNNITSVEFGENVTYYNKETAEKSWVFQWLNEDFLDTLYNNGADVIDTTKYWNATTLTNTDISTKPEETDATMIPTTTSPVGLLNSYEYYKSYQNVGSYASGYLNIGYNWWLLNSYNNSSMWRVSRDGSGYYSSSLTSMNGIRPSIYLKFNVSLNGSGSKSNPYRVVGDIANGNINENINTRISGEYVKIKYKDINQDDMLSSLYRIVSTEKSPLNNNETITKLVMIDYSDNNAKKKFASIISDTIYGSGTTTDTDTWYTYLNGTDTEEVHNNDGWFDNLRYKELLTKGTYYMGNGDSESRHSYKGSICATSDINNKTNLCIKTSNIGIFNVGLLRYGEMFATQQGSSLPMWLITKYDSTNVRVSDGSNSICVPSRTNGARPTIHLKSTVKILSGSGTELDPYIVS